MKKTIFIFILSLYTVSLYCQSEGRVDSLLIQYNNECRNLSFKQNNSQLNNILNLIKRIKYEKGEADVYRRFGILYKNEGNLKAAILYYIKSLEISDKINYRVASGSTCNNLSFVYYELGEIEKTIEYLKKAVLNFESEQYNRGLADVCGSLGEIYSEQGSFDTAIFYAEKSLSARVKLKDTADFGYYYHTLGYLYYKKNNYTEALKNYNIALNKLHTIDLVSTFNSIGHIYLEQKQYDTALRFYHMAYDTAYKYQNVPLLIKSVTALSKSYEVKGDTMSAFRYLKLASTLNDSMLDSTTRKAIIEMERRYDSDAKAREIEYQNTIIKNQDLKMWVIAAILLSLLFLGLILTSINIYKRRLAQKDAELQRGRVDELLQQQEVESVNAMLKGQDAERKRIAQELHDRLGSILATVKLHFSNVEESIRALKAQQTQSYQEANVLLDEACEEVRRISHDLYEGSLAKFGFRTALLQLIAAIEKTNALKITFLDNNTPGEIYKVFERDLYRITQELLGNTLKYANARQVTIQLNQQPGNFVYTYEDDGKGFSPGQLQAAEGIGYKNIETRVKYMGGSWHLDSSPGHGMTLVIEIPLNNGNH